jgi:hypothetical protein
MAREGSGDAWELAGDLDIVIKRTGCEKENKL